MSGLRRRSSASAAPIERTVHVRRPPAEVVAAFRGDPEATPDGVVLAVDEPDLLEWELGRRGLRGSRLSVSFSPEDDGTRVTSRFEPRLGGLLTRLRGRSLTHRYEDIVERVLERSRRALEEDEGEPDTQEKGDPG